nr:unnamed protein product [Callosobruchus chinensis]
MELLYGQLHYLTEQAKEELTKFPKSKDYLNELSSTAYQGTGIRRSSPVYRRHCEPGRSADCDTIQPENFTSHYVFLMLRQLCRTLELIQLEQKSTR